MYNVVISSGGSLFIISLLVTKIEIEQRCQIEGHIMPHHHSDVATYFIST